MTSASFALVPGLWLWSHEPSCCKRLSLGHWAHSTTWQLGGILRLPSGSSKITGQAPQVTPPYNWTAYLSGLLATVIKPAFEIGLERVSFALRQMPSHVGVSRPCRSCTRHAGSSNQPGTATFPFISSSARIGSCEHTVLSHGSASTAGSNVWRAGGYKNSNTRREKQ